MHARSYGARKRAQPPLDFERKNEVCLIHRGFNFPLASKNLKKIEEIFSKKIFLRPPLVNFSSSASGSMYINFFGFR